MNKQIEEKKKQINTVLNLLKKSKMSRENYQSSIEPFFQNDITSEKFKENYKTIPELPDSLNRHIKILFELIGNPEIEIYIGDWTIMSVNQCLERYNQLCKDNPDNIVFDIGFRYMGMGHVQMISCNLYNHLLFYRDDGGANGWEREANYDSLKNFDYKKYNYIFFTQWIDQFKYLIDQN